MEKIKKKDLIKFNLTLTHQEEKKHETEGFFFKEMVQWRIIEQIGIFHSGLFFHIADKLRKESFYRYGIFKNRREQKS